VCSGDIYVFERRGDRLLPDLLPSLCQTDAFFEHAVGTSAGSLSPRTNWTQLAKLEFALPPLEEQRRMAQVLGAAESCLSSTHEAVVCADWS
jgi:type I restriction enzyme S subunit